MKSNDGGLNKVVAVVSDYIEYVSTGLQDMLKLYWETPGASMLVFTRINFYPTFFPR